MTTMNNIDAKEEKYEEDDGEPWPDEEDRECNHVECDECGAYRNTDLDDFAGFCVFKGVIRTWYCQDCWEVHADTCRNPECPYACTMRPLPGLRKGLRRVGEEVGRN